MKTKARERSSNFFSSFGVRTPLSRCTNLYDHPLVLILFEMVENDVYLLSVVLGWWRSISLKGKDLGDTVSSWLKGKVA